MLQWFELESSVTLSTPNLLVYKDRVVNNIDSLIVLCKDVKRLRPHVKTNKIKEVCEIMLSKGIEKFKCATLAEMEMLCRANALDVLLAYPLIGYNITLLQELQKHFPKTHISFLVDDIRMVPILEKTFSEQQMIGNVFVDVNVGMGRTGCNIDKISDLVNTLELASSLNLVGFHAYDGHIHEGTPTERETASRLGTSPLLEIISDLETQYAKAFQIVIGGSPTFAQYISDEKIQLSPGTFVFWDWGYKKLYPELPFDYAALVVTRIISILAPTTICLDFGTKAIACEMPQPRMAFLNMPEAEILFQSEEHTVVKVSCANDYTLGQLVYVVPVHICPTVALYDRAYIVENNRLNEYWEIVGRKRFLTI